jgi:hypothetical protein
MGHLRTIHGTTIEHGHLHSRLNHKQRRGRTIIFKTRLEMACSILTSSCFLQTRFDDIVVKPRTAPEQDSQRSTRQQIYRRFVQTFPLPASNIETLYKHFDKLRDEEQQRVLNDSLRRRGYSETTFDQERSWDTEATSPQSRIQSARTILIDAKDAAPTLSKSRASTRDQPRSQETPERRVASRGQHLEPPGTRDMTYTHEQLKRDQDLRDFSSHHPFHQRFHNMEFLRRFPGNGVMKRKKKAA